MAEFCHERTFALFCGFPPPPPGYGQKCSGSEKWSTLLAHIFQALACSEAKNRHKTMFLEGYITQDIDSAFQIFALKDFLSYRPLKIVWADPPMAVRVMVKSVVQGKLCCSIYSQPFLNYIPED
jgi:hypothetical protein